MGISQAAIGSNLDANGVVTARSYTSAGIENGVAATSPHTLSVMLCHSALTDNQPGFAVTMDIGVGLDRKVDGQVAGSFDSLSGCGSSRLIAPNLKNQLEIPKEAHNLLADLKTLWVTFSAAPVPAKATAPNADLYKAQLMKA